MRVYNPAKVKEGMSRKKNLSGRRKYLRLNTIFPVECRVEDKEGNPLSGWIQAFSHDLGKGGLCLIFNVIDKGAWSKIKGKACLLNLKIHLPFSSKVIPALTVPAWWREGKGKEGPALFIGAEFFSIEPVSQRRLIRYAYFNYLSPKILTAVFIILLSLFLFSFYENKKMVIRNRETVEELGRLSSEVSLYRESLGRDRNEVVFLSNRIKSLGEELTGSKENLKKWREESYKLKQERVKLLKQGIDSAQALEKEKQAELKAVRIEKKLKDLERENAKLKDSLKEKILSAKTEEKTIKTLALRKENLDKTVLADMYKWLKTHQNLRTGLVMSFEGDSSLKGWSFTYDQALCVNVFLLYRDIDSAKRILDFYSKKAKVYKGGFLNAYYADEGSACEYKIQSGPNIWLGLSALRYTEFSGNREFLPLAERVAQFILNLQDSEGGVKGGLRQTWYATEHNLDAYAFFDGLYRITHKQKYLYAGNRVKEWLKKYSYTKMPVPVNRGKGDSAIATDTYAWSISAIGPKTLLSMGMDPDQIVDFAVKNCGVKTTFEKNGKEIKVEGFDFSKSRNLARGGVISTEWTSEMISAFNVMAKFYQDAGDNEKSSYYLNLADKYLIELAKMVISSPSPTGQGRGCLPYASQECADTGHGWRTPKGKRTCGISGTAYYIFANLRYNPLSPNLSPFKMGEPNGRR